MIYQVLMSNLRGRQEWPQHSQNTNEQENQRLHYDHLATIWWTQSGNVKLPNRKDPVVHPEE